VPLRLNCRTGANLRRLKFAISWRIFLISFVSGSEAVRRCARVGYFAVFALAAGFGFAGCHGKGQLTGQQAEGKQLYDVRCAHCHEYNDLALKKVPPNLHGVFNHAALPSGAPASDLQVARTVLTGKGMMPSFAGRFTTAQMEALLAYLHTSQFAQEKRP
jgi:mono/diheme cytochrome c family protein